eukprot:scaffold3167_cov121-Cylindrotheca_fusiformis.AAC.2
MTLVLHEGLERIGKGSLVGCEGLTKVDIPSTVKGIDDGAFYDCTRVMTLVLHEGLERIGENAFDGCRGLTLVDIPSTTKVIDCRAFCGCHGLETLRLCEGLESIGEGSFSKFFDSSGHSVNCHCDLLPCVHELQKVGEIDSE